MTAVAPHPRFTEKRLDVIRAKLERIAMDLGRMGGGHVAQVVRNAILHLWQATGQETAHRLSLAASELRGIPIPEGSPRGVAALVEEIDAARVSILSARQAVIDVAALSPPLDLSTPADLDGLPIPEREWIVPDWIPAQQTTLLYARGGSGKSLLAIQLLVATALGHPWIGLPVRRCRSLALFCEDDVDELHRRIEAVARSYGARLADLEGVRWQSRVGMVSTLMTFDGNAGELTDLAHEIEQAAVDDGAELVVLDTLADAFGGDLLSTPHARAFVQGVGNRIARAINGATLVLAHPSKSGIASGAGDGFSTAWENAARSRLYLSDVPTEDGAPGDPDLRLLSRMKANYSARSEVVTLRWSDGVFENLHPPGQGLAGALERHNREAAAEAAFLAALDVLTAQGRHVSATPSANFAPVVMVKGPHCQGYGKRDLTAAMERLFAKGAITIGPVGSYGNRTKKTGIIRAPEPAQDAAQNPAQDAISRPAQDAQDDPQVIQNAAHIRPRIARSTYPHTPMGAERPAHERPGAHPHETET